MFDIFNNNAFSVTSLTDAMREVKYVPSYVGKLGIFTETSVDTLDVAIETDAAHNIIIVPSTPRGAPGVTWGRNRRTMRNLRIPHFQVDDALMADTVQAVRAFGQEKAVEIFQTKIAERAAEASNHFALTEEYQRLAVITQGKLLDADGSTLFNYYTEMGESVPAEVPWDLLAGSPVPGALRKKATALTRAMGATLDGLPFTGILALCGDAFWDGLTEHSEVRDTFKYVSDAATLRQAMIQPNSGSVVSGSWGSFTLFDILWVNYRGGQSVSVDTNSCKFIPYGVPGLFRTVYGPADYIETVNTQGQRLYSKQWIMPNGKGVNLEFQTNVLHYCTRPRVLMSARLGS